ALEDAAVDLPLHAPAALVDTAHLAGDGNHGAVHRIHAPDFHVCQDPRRKDRVPPQLGADRLQLRNGLPDIGVVGHADAYRRVADSAVIVAHRGHRAERDDVQGAVAGTQAYGTDRQILHRTGNPGHRYRIAHLHGVFHQQEDSGDEVLHQLLRTEADRHTDDAGPGNQRGGVDTQLVERGQ